MPIRNDLESCSETGEEEKSDRTRGQCPGPAQSVIDHYYLVVAGLQGIQITLGPNFFPSF